MKRIILTITCLLLTSQVLAVAQTKISVRTDENLYLKGLSAYLQSAIKQYEGTKTRRDYRNLVVQKNIDITESLPPQIGNNKISYKDEAELIEQSLKQHTDLPITVIRPIKNEEAKLILSFSEYWFSYKNKKIAYSLEGGCKVEMRFDCTKGKYVIEKVEFWGV